VGETGEPVPVEVRLGLSDGTSTEITGGPLTEGAEVILGVAEPKPEKRAAGIPALRLF